MGYTFDDLIAKPDLIFDLVDPERQSEPLDINMQNEHGVTLAMIAAACGAHVLFETLKDLGADMNLRDKNGLSVAEYCIDAAFRFYVLNVRKPNGRLPSEVEKLKMQQRLKHYIAILEHLRDPEIFDVKVLSREGHLLSYAMNRTIFAEPFVSHLVVGELLKNPLIIESVVEVPVVGMRTLTYSMRYTTDPTIKHRAKEAICRKNGACFESDAPAEPKATPEQPVLTPVQRAVRPRPSVPKPADLNVCKRKLEQLTDDIADQRARLSEVQNDMKNPGSDTAYIVLRHQMKTLPVEIRRNENEMKRIKAEIQALEAGEQRDEAKHAGAGPSARS